MLIANNPSANTLAKLCQESSYGAVKWIKDTETGETWAWPASNYQNFHADIAEALHIASFEKGLIVSENLPDPESHVN